MLSKKSIIASFLSASFLTSCSSLRVNDKQLKEIQQNEIYEQALKVETLPDSDQIDSSKKIEANAVQPISTSQTSPKKGRKTSKKSIANDVKPKKAKNGATVVTESKNSSMGSTNPVTSQPALVSHLPAMEDGEGFEGRRPKNDPYRVGEKMVFAVKYFNMTAGTMSIETLPAKAVNGKLSYHFKVSVKSADSFAWIYTMDDWAETFVDYKTMVPYNYVINIKQKNEVGENRCLFDWETLNAKLWERKITESGKKERLFEWKLEPFSQNVLSLPLYLRSFQLTPQKKFSVPFGHRGENLVLAADVTNREILDTSFGPLKTIVVKPKFKLDGAFKPVGEIKLWYTDDEQKLLVRIESQIKVGTIVAEITSIQRGGSAVSVQ